MYGLTTKGNNQKAVPARKRTRFMSNSYHIIEELGRRCEGTHSHQPLVNGRAKDTEGYPKGLCRAICRGIIKEKARKEQRLSAVAEVHTGRSPDPQAHHEREDAEIKRLCEKDGEAAYDDVTGMPLDRAKVEAARKEEIDYVQNKMETWTFLL